MTRARPREQALQLLLIRHVIKSFCSVAEDLEGHLGTPGRDGTAWTQLEETGPIARAGHSMTFDSVRGRTVLFGGTKIDGTAQGDTWEWTGTAWIQVSEFGPGHRLSAAMSFDGSQSLLFGGLQFLSGPPGDTMGDTWSWDGRFWTQRQDIGPQPRTLHAMAFDSARKKTVLFGGAGPGRTFADTWEFSQRT